MLRSENVSKEEHIQYCKKKIEVLESNMQDLKNEKISISNELKQLSEKTLKVSETESDSESG